MKFKAKNETIIMNRNYRNADKKIWRVKYVHEHHAYENITLDIWMWEPFHNKFRVVVCWKMCGENYVQMYKL